MDNLIREDDRAVYGDRGYASEKRKRAARRAGALCAVKEKAKPRRNSQPGTAPATLPNWTSDSKSPVDLLRTLCSIGPDEGGHPRQATVAFEATRTLAVRKVVTLT